MSDQDSLAGQIPAGKVPESFLGATRSGRAEHNLYAKFDAAEHKTRGAAIGAMCATCMGCNATHMEPGYKQDIRDCASKSCPLWNFRPYKRESA